VKEETESKKTAAQDQTLQTKFHAKKYYKQKQRAHAVSTV
jgi:hypothetical protein